MTEMNLLTKQKQTDRHRKQIYGYQRGKVGVRSVQGCAGLMNDPPAGTGRLASTLEEPGESGDRGRGAESWTTRGWASQESSPFFLCVAARMCVNISHFERNGGFN